MNIAALLFEEATLSYEDDAIILKAPWMHTRITDWPGRPTARELYQHSSLQKLPFWYHAARPFEVLPPSLTSINPDPIALEELFVTAAGLIPGPFSWDLTELVQKSLCPDSTDVFDPRAAYAVLQRWILRDGLALNQLGKRVRQSFGDEGIAPTYRELLLDLVHFSYVVTRSCPAALGAARDYPGPAGSILRDFIDGECGHEIFAIHSLQLLTEHDDSCPLFTTPAELSLLLQILQQCAEASPLGLAACLFCFEGLTYDAPTWSPWSSLEALDPRHGIIGVGKHARINEGERHGEVGLELASTLPAQSFEDLCLAARLTELCVQTRFQLFRNVLKGRLDFGNGTHPESAVLR